MLFEKEDSVWVGRLGLLIDECQRNPKYQNVYAVGVCVAIPPVEAMPFRRGLRRRAV